jgi:ankyrin repeat protein
MRSSTGLALAIASVVFATTDSAQEPGNGKVDFARDVQPILRQQCYGCHGPTKQTNGFRLDRRSDAMRGSTVNPGLIRPGNSAASFMFARIAGDAFGPQMPPTGALRPEQIATIKAWIDQGAEWPDALAGETPVKPADPRATRAADALRAGDVATFKSLAAADPKVGSLRGPAGSTPLMYAVLYGDVAATRLLLDGGADPNIRNDAGATALMWAVSDLEKTRLLLDRGANPNAKSDDGRTPLLIASGLFGGAPVVKLLLDRGADINVKAPGFFGESTPVAEAAYTGDEAVFQLLIARGADVQAGGPGQIALALRAQCMPCVETLIKALPPPLVTPAMVFSTPPLGTAAATTLLLERGGDVTAKDPQGRTLLTLAAASDEMPVDVVKTLLTRGVDVNAKSPTGETALGHALRRGNTPIVELLRKAGATDAPAPEAPVATPSPAKSPRAAIERSLPLLQRTDTVFLKRSGCVSCHNDTLTAMAVSEARLKGIPVNEAVARENLKTIAVFVEGWREKLVQGIGIPGDADTVSYILLGMAAEHYPADAATDAMAHFLKRQQRPNGQWRPLAHRPPIESSDIQATAASMRALQLYGPAAGRTRYDTSIRLAADWLAKARPANLQDRAFQLLGLKWAGADAQAIQTAARAIVALQQPDGGWGQFATLGSDAYATGQALVALNESGAIKTGDAVYTRGVQFLLNTQFEDGSWFVRTRAIALQPLFDIGFPHGPDSWISAAATNWATLALARATTKIS